MASGGFKSSGAGVVPAALRSADPRVTTGAGAFTREMRSELRTPMDGPPPAPRGRMGGRPRSQSFYGVDEYRAVVAERGALAGGRMGGYGGGHMGASGGGHMGASDGHMGGSGGGASAGLSTPLTTLLHNPGSSPARTGIAEKGLLPMLHRDNPTTKTPYAGGTGGSNHNANAVYAAGPNVISGHHMADAASDYVHVVAKSQIGFIHDHDYDHLGFNNDSLEHPGAIPPARTAQHSHEGAVSFTLPLTPRTEAGLSRYLTGSEAHGPAATAVIGGQFQKRFGGTGMGYMSRYAFPDLPAHGAMPSASRSGAGGGGSGGAGGAGGAGGKSNMFADREHERALKLSTATTTTTTAASPFASSARSTGAPTMRTVGFSVASPASPASPASGGSSALDLSPTPFVAPKAPASSGLARALAQSARPASPSAHGSDGTHTSFAPITVPSRPVPPQPALGAGGAGAPTRPASHPPSAHGAKGTE